MLVILHRKHAQRAGNRVDGMEPGVLEAQSADWPERRELENTVERAVVLSPSAVIGPDVVRFSASTAPCLPSLNLRQNLDWAERVPCGARSAVRG